MTSKKFDSELLGANELETALRTLAPMIVGLKGYPKNVLRNAARTGAKIAEEDAANRAHNLRTIEGSEYRRTGRLEDAITVKIMSTKYRDMATLQGNSREYFYIGAKSGTGRDDPNGAYYANFVERGTDKMEARPFMRPAVESNTAKLTKTIGDKLGADLLRIAKKIGDENTRALLAKGVKV